MRLYRYRSVNEIATVVPGGCDVIFSDNDAVIIRNFLADAEFLTTNDAIMSVVEMRDYFRGQVTRLVQIPYSPLQGVFIFSAFMPCALPEGDVHVFDVPCVVLSSFHKEEDFFDRSWL